MDYVDWVLVVVAQSGCWLQLVGFQRGYKQHQECLIYYVNNFELNSGQFNRLKRVKNKLKKKKIHLH